MNGVLGSIVNKKDFNNGRYHLTFEELIKNRLKEILLGISHNQSGRRRGISSWGINIFSPIISTCTFHNYSHTIIGFPAWSINNFLDNFRDII